MPKKKLLPEWEKEENRSKVVFTMLKNPPMTFAELVEKTGLSRATLTSHLGTLEREGRIERKSKPEIGKREKWARKRRTVYQIVHNEKKLLSELKSLHFDMLVELAYIEPFVAEMLEAHARGITQFLLRSLERQANGKPSLSMKEELVLIYKTLQANSSPEIRKITHLDEILEGIEAKPETSPEFRKLQEIKAKMKERFEKHKERHS